MKHALRIRCLPELRALYDDALFLLETNALEPELCRETVREAAGWNCLELKLRQVVPVFLPPTEGAQAIGSLKPNPERHQPACHNQGKIYRLTRRKHRNYSGFFRAWSVHRSPDRT
jgi:hypothetical protein